MSTFSWPVQQAVYAVLTAANIAGDRIYDKPPDDAVFPYVEIGDGDAIPDDVTTSAGSGDSGLSETITLHVWSRYRGQKEAKEIIAAIHTALHGVSLTVTGRTSALAWVRPPTRVFRDPDGLTTHGVVSVEVIHRTSA